MAYFRMGKITVPYLEITLYVYGRGSGDRASSDYNVSTSTNSTITMTGATKITMISGSITVNNVSISEGESMDLNKLESIVYKISKSAKATKASTATNTAVFRLFFN